jgi:hypothetical protein
VNTAVRDASPPVSRICTTGASARCELSAGDVARRFTLSEHEPDRVNNTIRITKGLAKFKQGSDLRRARVEAEMPSLLYWLRRVRPRCAFRVYATDQRLARWKRFSTIFTRLCRNTFAESLRLC